MKEGFMNYDEMFGKIMDLVKKEKSVSIVCEKLELKDYEFLGLIQLMKEKGFLIDVIDGQVIRLKEPQKKNDTYILPNKLDRIELLLISDTHLASSYDRVDILKYLYNKADEKGVKYVLHSGDFTDGHNFSRPEHSFELKEQSYEGQIDYCVEKYPKFDGKTIAIAGNHDFWWTKQAGSDIVKSIASQREDLLYLGPDVGDVKIGKLRIRLYHGAGGVAYSKSYKMQKYLDSIPLEERPDILQTGHIHQAFYMKQDNTHCFQTGCLEDQTPYTRSKGLANNKSCWWVTAEFDDDGNIHSIKPELEEFGNKKIKIRR